MGKHVRAEFGRETLRVSSSNGHWLEAPMPSGRVRQIGSSEGLITDSWVFRLLFLFFSFSYERCTQWCIYQTFTSSHSRLMEGHDFTRCRLEIRVREVIYRNEIGL